MSDELLDFYPDSDKDEDNFACQIGTHNQTVTTHIHTYAVLSRFTFSYPNNFRTRSDSSGKDGATNSHAKDGATNSPAKDGATNSPAKDGATNSCSKADSPVNCITAANSSATYSVDADGDPILIRKGQSGKEDVVLIEHQQSTSLSLVGEQVWRGALYLADYLLHLGRGHKPISQCQEVSTNTNVENAFCINETDQYPVFGKRVLELASGVGLTSIVAAITADTVIVTDIDRGNILELVRRNLSRNTALLGGGEVLVRQLDFSNHDTIDQLSEELEGVTLILAADVVYNNELTDQFFSAVRRIMSQPPDKMMLVALEKRYVFTLADMDTVAPCYEYFLQCLEALRCDTSVGVAWDVDQVDEDAVPQYFAYERTSHLVLWRVRATKHT